MPRLIQRAVYISSAMWHEVELFDGRRFVIGACEIIPPYCSVERLEAYIETYRNIYFPKEA